MNDPYSSFFLRQCNFIYLLKAGVHKSWTLPISIDKLRLSDGV